MLSANYLLLGFGNNDTLLLQAVSCVSQTCYCTQLALGNTLFSLFLTLLISFFRFWKG